MIATQAMIQTSISLTGFVPFPEKQTDAKEKVIANFRKVITPAAVLIKTRGHIIKTREEVITPAAVLIKTRKHIIKTRKEVIAPAAVLIKTREPLIKTRAGIIKTRGQVITSPK